MPDSRPIHSERPLIVTGASGFIGRHVMRTLADRRRRDVTTVDLSQGDGSPAWRHKQIDIRQPNELRRLVELHGRPDALIHLAASAEVVMPWADVSTLLSTNIEGTYNVLDAFRPRVVAFASSCSVYGNVHLDEADPASQPLQPLSLYGMSKVAAEMVIREWTRTFGASAVILRFGNVIGPGCRGLLQCLAQHARQFPQGGVPVRLRGDGRLVRDYVPVQSVVDALLAATEMDWAPGTVVTVNVGTGRAMTNRDVFEIARSVANERGYQLEATFDDPPQPGEASEIVVRPDSLVRELGIPVPTPEQVVSAIAGAMQVWL